MNSKFRAVLFDLDGTLLNTIEDLSDSMNRVLTILGFPGHPVEAYRYFVGEGMEMLVRRSLPASEMDEETVDNCLALMRGEYDSHWHDKTRPYPGIEELLTALPHHATSLAVLSNKPHEMTVKVINHFFPKTPFAAVWGARPGMAKKPSPQGALLLAEELGLAPENFLYVGDTATDMQTARRAGMTAVGAAWGFRTVEELLGSGADCIAEQPLEIVQLLREK